MLMEKIRCDLCGADDAALFMEERDRFFNRGEIFTLVRCRQCGLVYLNPRPTPEEMARYYPDEYVAFSRAIEDEPGIVNRLDRMYGIYKKCRAVVSAQPSGGRLLDLGCATGNFLNAMRARDGWEVYGVEVNANAAEYARRRFGLNVFTGELADAHFPDKFFDVVTLWDVLEHLHEPTRTLREIGRILVPGGLLVASMPNLDSLDARLFSRYWVGLDAPRHLYVFTPDTARALFIKTGYRLERICSFTGGYLASALSLTFWLDEHLGSESIKQMLRHVLYSPLIRLLALPWFTLLGRLNRITGMTLFATHAGEVEPTC